MNFPDEASFCPITGAPGYEISRRSSFDLIESYRCFLGIDLPVSFQEKYFMDSVSEYECGASGLRWFAPAVPADEDFYAFLGESCQWYYESDTWDQLVALKFLKKLPDPSFVEMGCGEGHFLRSALQAGITGVGIDINTAAIEKGRRAGLPIFHPEEVPAVAAANLCLFQVLEHLSQPVETLESILSKRAYSNIIISVPCHDTLLGLQSDPLSWPPHHMTFWSRRAIVALARRIGYRVKDVRFDPVNFRGFVRSWRKERRLDSPLGKFRSFAPNDFVSKALDRLRDYAGRFPFKTLHKAVATIDRIYGDDLTAESSPPAFARLRWLHAKVRRRTWATRRHGLIAILGRV